MPVAVLPAFGARVAAAGVVAVAAVAAGLLGAIDDLEAMLLRMLSLRLVCTCVRLRSRVAPRCSSFACTQPTAISRAQGHGRRVVFCS